jgi:predicted NBD/HSP70 family sugar kinase
MNANPSPANASGLLISGRPQLNRRINLAIVLDLIMRKGPLSRADLVKETGIRATSISSIVEHLIKEDLVKEIGLGVSTGGRQPVLLELRADGRYGIGIELQKTAINCILVNMRGQVLQKMVRPLPNTDVNAVVRQMQKATQEFMTKRKLKRKSMVGIGVAVPGIISKDEGRVVLSRTLSWKNMMLKPQLEKLLGLSTHVLNNATAGALTAHFDAPPEKATGSLLYVLIMLRHSGTENLAELGCGIVLDGRAYLGEGHMAGEIRVDIRHPRAIVRERSGGKKTLTLDELIQLSLKTPDAYAYAWDDIAEHVGRVIGRGIDFLSPGRVVIGSDVPELEQVVGDRIRQEAHDHSVNDIVNRLPELNHIRPVPIDFSVIAEDTLARGAIVPHLMELSLAPRLRESVLV